MRSFGTLIFGIGIIMLMSNLGWFDSIDWSVVWPVVFIVVGIWFVLKSGKSCTCSSLCKVAGLCHGNCGTCHPASAKSLKSLSAKNGSKK